MSRRLRECAISRWTDEDDDGWFWVVCGCGAKLGPAPDQETVVDMAMEHAFDAGAASHGSSSA